MRILVVSVQVPFVVGGAEILAQQLIVALRQAGHEVEFVGIPFRWYPPEQILDHLLACRLLDITESCGTPVDLVIGLKFPAYHIKHPNKVIWMLHQHRTAFELWDAPEGDLVQFPDGSEVRHAITHLEVQLLAEARAIYTISRNVSARLSTYSGIEAPPLYPPLQDAELFYTKEPEDYLFCPSRISGLKRQELVIRALACTHKRVRVVFAGRPDNPDSLVALQGLAKRLGVTDRVVWLGGISEEEKRERYARCLGVLFVPLNEDYGYVTIEAMLARKPVITCSDSGGPLEFVRHDESGYIAEPTPEALAAAMDRLWGDLAFSRRAGTRGRGLLDELGMSWPNVVRKLLNEA